MRILVTIPHFFRPADATRRATVLHGCEHSDEKTRAEALSSAVAALHQHFGPRRYLIQIAQRRTVPVAAQSCQLHVVICTVGAAHALSCVTVDASMYQHYPTDVDPRMLGFACHRILRDRWGNYDFYCYLEDDLILSDPWFFRKLQWFNRHVGDDKVLQPNRFERGRAARLHKVYIDGDLAADVTSRFQNVREEPRLKSTVMGMPLLLRRTLNPHSGCFFLNASQMKHWIDQPHFGRDDASFVGPLESAATLGIMRTFRVYKPAEENADFLEVEHSGTQFLDAIKFDSP